MHDIQRANKGRPILFLYWNNVVRINGNVSLFCCFDIEFGSYILILFIVFHLMRISFAIDNFSDTQIDTTFSPYLWIYHILSY